MSSRHYIIVLSSLPIRRSDVKSGRNDPVVVTACRCVNVGLFLSNDLRRDVTVSFMITDGVKGQVISFPGQVLRRVSPDERSISFFILKAWELLDGIDEGTAREMDNGITIEKKSLTGLFEDWKGFQIFRAIQKDIRDLRSIDGVQYGIYLYEVQQGLLDDVLNRSDIIKLYRPQSPERFILDINHRMDSISELSSKKAS